MTPKFNNLFENVNISNGNLNNSKKKNIILGIFIAVMVICCGVGLFLLNNNPNHLLNSNIKKITNEDINNYNLKSLARWGNISLGISYLIPTSSDTGLFSTNGSKSFSYLHGHSFEYGNGYDIYVEKSLDGSKNLETLPLDINTEKESEKYEYEFSSHSYGLDEIALTEKVIIGDRETVYFESNEFDTRVLYGLSMVDAKAKYIGYSFQYDDSYYSVYGKIGYITEEETEEKELLQKYLHYVINSFQKYNKESFYELDNNFNLKSLLDSGVKNKEYKELNRNERQFVINKYGSHMTNGIYGGSRGSNLLSLDRNLLNWDGNVDNIYNSVINSNSYTMYLDFIDSGQIQIIQEASEKINGIAMKKYIIKHTFAGMIDYFVVYTFVVDNNPYLFQYSLNYYYKSSDNLTDEQQNMIKEVTDIVGSTLIRTIRFIEFDSNSDNKYLDYI